MEKIITKREGKTMSEKLKKPIYKRWWFITIAVVVILGFIGSIGNGDNEAQQASINKVSEKEVVSSLDDEKEIVQTDEDEGKEEIKSDEVIEKPEEKLTEEPKEKLKEEPKEDKVTETLSQKNAVRKAEQYLRTMPFSKSGLIAQLEFEGFSTEDATYAVNKIDVNWKEQAVKKAKSYLDTMAFSRSGLIEQLEFEGFTTEEATYAVDQIGL